MSNKKLREYNFLLRNRETIRIQSSEDLIELFLKDRREFVFFRYKAAGGESLIDCSQVDAIVVSNE